MLLLQSLSFSDLTSYHKSEGNEEMAYLGIIFTVALGLLGFVGGDKHISRQVRLVMAGVFAMFYALMVSAFLGSMRIHSALHTEISAYIQNHPDLFITGELRETLLCHLRPQPLGLFAALSIGLGIVVVIGILSLGEGRVFSLIPKKKE